jgi:uncharacterized protein (DUF1499 family)
MLFNFEQVILPSTPNYCLIAPTMQKTNRWLQPIIFNMEKSSLEEKWKYMLVKQPRITLLAREHGQVKYVQHSALFKFKDIIVVQFNEIDSQHSSLFLYSHSLSGYWDLGVNCKRLHRWIAAL